MKRKIKIYDYEPIGARIKTARTNKKYTQEYVSEQLNVTCQHISNIERGLGGLSVQMLMDLCTLLNVSSDYILFGVKIDDNYTNPTYDILNKMDTSQKMYTEEIIKILGKYYGIK